MEIRIIKRPPAPLMDGFDMRGLEVGRVYVLDQRLARYLVAGGYTDANTRLICEPCDRKIQADRPFT